MADKYIDIYRELIDKEAQRKQEEQEYLKKHPGLVSANAAGIGSSGNLNSNQSRNKHPAKSDNKRNAKKVQQVN